MSQLIGSCEVCDVGFYSPEDYLLAVGSAGTVFMVCPNDVCGPMLEWVTRRKTVRTVRHS